MISQTLKAVAFLLSKHHRRKVFVTLFGFVVVYGIFYNHAISDRRQNPLEKLSSAVLPLPGLFASPTVDNDIIGLPNVTIESRPHFVDGNRSTIIAVGGGMTSRGVVNVSTSNSKAKFQFFHTFMPTFCETASANYFYKFYLAFDANDPVFVSNELATSFMKTFAAETRQLCERPRGVRTSLHLVQCDHSHRPAWAQNDAMLEAYIDHADYYYRVNDDTKMITKNWTEKFIAVLDGFDPRRVGVVGPNHAGGNIDILTYDFVHRTHIDAFGFHYPRLFTDWWADDWVTKIYRPNRSIKVADIRLQHTMSIGQRYGVRAARGGKILDAQLDMDKRTLDRYISAVRLNKDLLPVKSDGHRIISMSLYGHAPRYVWGVIRNAQLIPVYFPGWRLRVYVLSASLQDSVFANLTVSTRVIDKLHRLGVDIYRVTPDTASFSLRPRDWRLLATADETIDYFLIRDADGRLNDRDAAAVMEWINAVERAAANGVKDAFPVHRLFDHKLQANMSIVDGLWGGRPSALRRKLKDRFLARYIEKFRTEFSTNSSDLSPLGSVFEPILHDDDAVFCHRDLSDPCADSVPFVGNITSACHPFPVARHNGEYVGVKYDEHQERTDNVKCVKSITTTTSRTTSVRSTVESRVTSLPTTAKLTKKSA